jgi:hypothetical protein
MAIVAAANIVHEILAARDELFFSHFPGRWLRARAKSPQRQSADHKVTHILSPEFAGRCFTVVSALIKMAAAKAA